MKNYLELLAAMTEKELKVRYKAVYLGFVWMIIHPMIQMFIIGVIFSVFVDTENYFVYLFSGLVPWLYFSSVISKGTTSFVNERMLIKKAKFPLEIIPASVVLSNLIHSLVTSSLFVIFLAFNSNEINFNMITFFFSYIWMSLVSFGLLLLTSSLHVRFRDINFAVQSSIQLLFYATPILYELGALPDKLLIFYYINPLTMGIELYRCSTMGFCYTNHLLFAMNVLFGLLILLLGCLFFIKQRKTIVDWL